MTKDEIKDQLRESHQGLWDACESMDFILQRENFDGKWSALQHIQHVRKGIEAISAYLNQDKSMLRNKFGLINRTPMHAQELSDFYLKRLNEGVVSTERFHPGDCKDTLLSDERSKGSIIIDDMIESMAHWSDRELDQYICTHPTLGGLTVREMLCFAIIHARHHTKGICKIKDHTSDKYINN